MNNRVTVIYGYEYENVKYIFNRSVQWDRLIGSKYIKVLDVIGECYVVQQLKKFSTDVSSAPNWMTSKIYPLEWHPEWENINRADQRDINVCKKRIAEEMGGVIRYTDIEVDIEDKANKQFDLFLPKFRQLFQKWFMDIQQAINKNFKNLAVYTEPGTIQKLKEMDMDIQKVKNELERGVERLERLKDDYKHSERIYQGKIERKKEYEAYLDKRIAQKETHILEGYSEGLRNEMRTRKAQAKEYLEDLNIPTDDINISLEDYEEIYGESY